MQKDVSADQKEVENHPKGQPYKAESQHALRDLVASSRQDIDMVFYRSLLSEKSKVDPQP